MSNTTMTVEIRATRVWLLRARIIAGAWLIRVAAAVMGVGRIELKGTDADRP